MSVALWIVQGLLSLAFLMAGGMKLAQSKDDLAASGMAWTEDFSEGAVKLIGALEVLGAIGVVLPALTGVLTWLTPLAALGLVLTMAGAILIHLRRNETSALFPPAVLLALAAFVVYGRFFVLPVN